GLAGGVLLVFARLHNGGVQVKIVRHDRGAQNTNGDVKHVCVFDNLEPGDKATEDFCDVRLGKNDLGQEAPADGEDQGDDERLYVAKAFVLEIHYRQDIQRSNADAPHQRDLKQQVQGDSRADDLSQVASTDGHFAEQPEHD